MICLFVAVRFMKFYSTVTLLSTHPLTYDLISWTFPALSLSSEEVCYATITLDLLLPDEVFHRTGERFSQPRYQRLRTVHVSSDKYLRSVAVFTVSSRLVRGRPLCILSGGIHSNVFVATCDRVFSLSRHTKWVSSFLLYELSAILLLTPLRFFISVFLIFGLLLIPITRQACVINNIPDKMLAYFFPIF